MKENKSNNLIQKVADRYLKFKEESLKKEEA